MEKRRNPVYKTVFILATGIFFFLPPAFARSGAGGANAFVISSEVVTITETYPPPFVGYQNMSVRDKLILGSLPGTNWFQSDGSAMVYGDVSILNDSAGNYGGLTVKNCLFRVAPDYAGDQTGKGPYGWDGLRIMGDGTGNVLVGSDPTMTNMKFKAQTALAGGGLYVMENGLTTNTNKLYGQARGFTDSTQATTLLKKKAQFRAMYDNGTPDNFTDDTVYGPMRVEGYYIRLGEKYNDRATFGSAGGKQGNMDTVLIGTLMPYTVAVPESLFLQVGAQGDGSAAAGDWYVYSSREYKKDILPFSPAQCSEALAMIVRTPVWHYRFTGDAPDHKLRMGLITEESPKEMVTPDGKALSISDTFGYLSAAMKELITENNKLKKRLDALEKKKLAFQRIKK